MHAKRTKCNDNKFAEEIWKWFVFIKLIQFMFVVNIFSSSNKKLNIFIFLQSLKPSAPVYGLDISYFEIPHWAAVFMPLCNPITHQLIMLESCSSPQKTCHIFQFAIKEFFSSFGLWVFVGDVVNGVGLGNFFVEVIWPLVPIAQGKYFAQVFIGS